MNYIEQATQLLAEAAEKIAGALNLINANTPATPEADVPVSEGMPEGNDAPEVPENPEAINTAIEEGAADLTPAETATDPDPISTEGEIGSQE